LQAILGAGARPAEVRNDAFICRTLNPRNEAEPLLAKK